MFRNRHRNRQPKPENFGDFPVDSVEKMLKFSGYPKRQKIVIRSEPRAKIFSAYFFNRRIIFGKNKMGKLPNIRLFSRMFSQNKILFDFDVFHLQSESENE